LAVEGEGEPRESHEPTAIAVGHIAPRLDFRAERLTPSDSVGRPPVELVREYRLGSIDSICLDSAIERRASCSPQD
jgi:hypothetical protein